MDVLVFGTFDPLHEGHVQFLRQARALGDVLTVVVTRDSVIRTLKGREPFHSEQERVARLSALDSVDVVLLGDVDPLQYQLFEHLDFDVLALGYDQEPSDAVVRRKLAALGKSSVSVVRLQAFKPDHYKSSFFRGDS